MDDLRVFECATFAHVKQGKLESRALKCVFLGFPERIKGYKLWFLEPGSQKHIISRDVTFKEDVFPLEKTLTLEELSERAFTKTFLKLRWSFLTRVNEFIKSMITILSNQAMPL